MDNLVGTICIISGVVFYWVSAYKIFHCLDKRERDKRFMNANLKIVI